ncbi:SDR family NAD(P)-dependent oxidoreductase [Haloarcula salinisoli]|uniref:SDR family oxidoreductase n=1 Tax=Haloarcula salinisoli TaxID=2487746 RepID=A0A8J8C9J6_9EURY|nr:SDR family oxidoreductase [Halomicroarcula salinisoli]MBX0288250.1 SDR family oxidoreductase [Halomicroarcula salinisoli]MBX0305412.1 SDR family oxidoreductase [Halomicroarcula salinisoli]
MSDPDPLLITGASSGIGRSLAKRFAGEYHVIGVARRIERMTDEYADEPWVTPYELDLSDAAAVSETLAELQAEFGTISHLINNAGVNRGDTLLDADERDLRLSMEVNAFAPVQILQALLPGMRERDFGRVINVTSGAPLNCPPGAGAYSASKAALNTYTRTAAAENDDRDIKINLMSPGPCRTEMAPDAPLPPSACHSTAEYLLDLDAEGPTGEFFWLEHRVPLTPDLSGTEWEAGEPGPNLEPIDAQ